MHKANREWNGTWMNRLPAVFFFLLVPAIFMPGANVPWAWAQNQTAEKSVEAAEEKDKNPEYKREIQRLNAFIREDATDADAFYNRGWVYGSKGDVELALKDYSRAIELDGGDEDAFYNRGLIYAKIKDYEKALADFKKTLELNPEAVDAYCNMGNVHYKMGKLDEAIRDYTAALKLNPDDGDLYYNRGVVYLSKGWEEKAMNDLKRAAQGGQEEARKYLGLPISKASSGSGTSR